MIFLQFLRDFLKLFFWVHFTDFSWTKVKKNSVLRVSIAVIMTSIFVTFYPKNASLASIVIISYVITFFFVFSWNFKEKSSTKGNKNSEYFFLNFVSKLANFGIRPKLANFSIDSELANFRIDSKFVNFGIDSKLASFGIGWKLANYGIGAKCANLDWLTSFTIGLFWYLPKKIWTFSKFYFRAFTRFSGSGFFI